MADRRLTVDFSRELDAYCGGGIDLEVLLGQIDRYPASSPDQRDEILAELEARYRENLISPADYQLLSRHIEQATGEPEPLASEVTPVRFPAEAAATASLAHSTPAKPSSLEMAGRPLAGDILNERFVLEKEIGRGGMAVVFKARDLRKEEAMDRHPYVAVKVLGPEFIQKSDAFIALQRECKKAQRLAHPNIATVYDFDRDGDKVYMTMELLEGESVADLLKRVEPGFLDFKQAWPIIRDMAEGLGYAHGQGIVHSDFKPANAFVLAGGKVKVLDFGIARAVTLPGQEAKDNTVFKPTWEALTPAYASCDMFEKAPPDPRDDIYGLACVAYELLTGNHPFDKLPAYQARSQKRVARDIIGLSRKQNQALRHALAFDRNRRTTGTGQFIAELGGDANGFPRGIAVWLAALLLTGIAAVSGFYYFLATPPSLPADESAVSIVAITDNETLASIDRILKMADLHWRVGRLVEPPGSNAFEAYQAVLQLQASNAEALAGMDRIAGHYLERGRVQFEEGELRPALLDVEQGLELFPDNPELKRLQRQITGQMNR